MKFTSHIPAIVLLAALGAPAIAQETRHADAHVHGVSKLEMAIEGTKVAMNLFAPGADIVGFEHAASTDADKDAVEAAILQFTRPQELFAFDAAAECRVTEIMTHVHDHAHDHDEDGDDHAEHKHGDDHKEMHDDHKHGEDKDHAEHKHGEHKHDDHKEGHAEKHEDHAHEGHAEEGENHNEYHARMEFDCEHPEKLVEIGLPYFTVFPNAQEIEVFLATDKGADMIEVSRDQSVLSLEGRL